MFSIFLVLLMEVDLFYMSNIGFSQQFVNGKNEKSQFFSQTDLDVLDAVLLVELS